MYELKVFTQKSKLIKVEKKITKGIFITSEEVKIKEKVKQESLMEFFARIKNWANENKVKIVSIQKGDRCETVHKSENLNEGITVALYSFIVLYEKSEIPEGNLVTL